MSLQDMLGLISLVLALLGGLWGIGKLLFGQIDRRLEERFKTIDKNAQEWRRLETDFLRFQAQLPLEYVRREDWVRNQSVIESKLDGLATKMENMTLRAQQQSHD